MSQEPSLYARLGGYDAITAVVSELLPRLQSDSLLGRFWQHRGDDGVQREKQLLIDFLVHASGGPMYYTGRNMTLTHRGMRISTVDWECFLKHVRETLATFPLEKREVQDVLDFVESTRSEIVETA